MLDHEPEVLGVLSTRSIGRGHLDLRVVAFDDHPPVVENRAFIRDRVTGEERVGRNKGLTLLDMELLVAHWPHIKALLLSKSGGAAA